MALASDLKGKASPVLYVAGILGAWIISAWIGLGFFVCVALMWLIPDRRLEKRITAQSGQSQSGANLKSK
jgi:hypothetical protein